MAGTFRFCVISTKSEEVVVRSGPASFAGRKQEVFKSTEGEGKLFASTFARGR